MLEAAVAEKECPRDVLVLLDQAVEALAVLVPPVPQERQPAVVAAADRVRTITVVLAVVVQL